MSSNNRATLIGKLHNALKKHYQPISTGSRPLLEHVLYASLLQDAPYELADEGIAKCEQEFFDWNEVRVTTVTELSQVLGNLPDPVKAAGRLKGNLQDIFEEFYSFDIDILRKENLGKAVAKFENMPNMTPFVLAYTVQNGLGGHSIPVDYAGFLVMLTTGVITQSEAAESKVPGLERAIPKTKGIEFGTLLHQCGVALMEDPKDKTARAVLDAVDKGSSARLDSWLQEKELAIERVRARKTDERETARVEAASEDEEAPPTKTKAGKSKASKSATVKTPASKSAAAKAIKAPDTDAATKPSEPTKPKSVSKAPVSKAPDGKTPGSKVPGSKVPGSKTAGEAAAESTKEAKTAKSDKGAKTPKKPLSKQTIDGKKPGAKSVKVTKSPKSPKSASKSDAAPVSSGDAAAGSTKSDKDKADGSKPGNDAKTGEKKKPSENRKLTKKKPR